MQVSLVACRRIHGQIFRKSLVTSENLSYVSRRNMAGCSEAKTLERNGKRTIAFRKTEGGSPGVVFCSGYWSTMMGEKATMLEEFCRKKKLAYVRFDYQCCGASPGDPREATLSHWKEDVLDVLDLLTQGPQIIVGSSMGGWLGLIAAMERPERVQAFIGIAASPDFPDRKFQQMPKQVQEKIMTTGEVDYPSSYGQFIMTRDFLLDSRQHNILHFPTIPVHRPIRLLHGVKDDAVPYMLSLSLMQKLESNDIDVILRKDGDHRLSREEDLQLLLNAVDEMVKKVQGGSVLSSL
ncbi:mycophenolic acid acyl-glucuronide esterase, mitochondrial-like [Lingula anatina]|uniref:Palmitoyl-protein thioesterase ABHD10, mitochondrial n=1 Tax=Lingula anatina TaxID=7574 RepID=A0A1S3HLK0_LINAN|nr:mycophenolic acid acyl-glucuronide esterase, mitochondrial-like [Lingula anatina]|eukprot:XP_013386341.1 mycophenolic acid acyl-glucuronide esterase, mitochondrial-like [Lingula anatina]